MPYTEHKLKSGKVTVTSPHGVKSYGSTKENADKQVRLLHAIDHGFVPTKGRNHFAKRMGMGSIVLALLLGPSLSQAQTVQPGNTTTQAATAIACADPNNSLTLVPCDILGQGTTLNNAQSTSAANTAQTITLTGTAGKRWTLRQIYGACSAGSTTAITVQNGATTILSVPGLSTTISAVIPSAPSSGITISTGANLVVNIPTCGVSNTSTVSVIADQQ